MGRKERRGSIERQIITSILWVGVTPIILALMVGYTVIHEAQRKAVQRTLATAAEKTANGVMLAINSRNRTLSRLSADPSIVEAVSQQSNLPAEKRDAVLRRLKNEAKSGDEIPSVFRLLNLAGGVILSTGTQADEERDSHASEERHWSRVTKPTFIDFDYSLEMNTYIARTMAPVEDPATGERVGFITEDQSISSLIAFALGHKHQEDDEFDTDMYQIAYVSERRQVVLTSYLDVNAVPPLQTTYADEGLAERLLRSGSEVSDSLQIWKYATLGGPKHVLLAYHHLAGREGSYQVYVVVYRLAETAYSTINLWALFTLGGSSIVIGLFCVLAYRRVHNNIVRPLALLNEGAQIIRHGDLELKLKIGTGDEIEELALSFNKMAQALNQNIRRLEESEEKYRSLVTSMRDGVYQTDLDGVLTFLNPAGAEIFGYDRPQDALGQNLQELFLEEIDFARISSELAKQGFIERTRIWMKRKDGRSICVELSGNRVLDDEKKAIGSEGIFRDVTNSVRLEQQARERSERISAINQIANVINSSLEAGRVHESLVAELNRLVRFSYAAVTIIDESEENYRTRQLYPELGMSANVSRIPFSESCAGWVTENRHHLIIDDFAAEDSVRKGEFPEGIKSCLCVPLYATGRIIGTLNLGADKPFAFSKHDIEVLLEMTPHIAVAIRNARLLENLQQSLEEVTRARERLHEANEELKTLDELKTNLLSNVSHELRTPLVAIMGYADMISNKKAGPVNEIQSEYLGIILRNVEKLVALIENLLDFSRLHRGTEKLVFDQFDLVECARSSIQVVQPLADNRFITVHLTSSLDKITVEGDKGKMGQVFNNLFSNAVKFNRNGGEIYVEIQQREDSVEVTVSDTGIGIPAEAMDKVFTRFYQYDSSSTRKYGGTGIGLSIAQDIVRLHGGRITLSSEVGKGSVFRFSLPLTAAAEEAGAQAPLLSDTRLLVGLITEDRPYNLQLREQLAPEGMDVIHASSVNVAVALTKKHKPDCLLFDADSFLGAGHVPVQGTKTIVDELLKDETLSSVPVVLLSNNEFVLNRYKQFVSSCVLRDFRKANLLRGVQFAVSQSQAVPVSDVQPGTKILCVDDDPEVLIFIERCLKAEGYMVDVCESGREALRRLDSLEYGLVLLDVAMPGVDGWEVCRRIKANQLLTGVKVYLVTAKPVDRTPGRIQEVGADGYFLKPFRPDHLTELVREIIPLQAPRD